MVTTNEPTEPGGRTLVIDAVELRSKTILNDATDLRCDIETCDEQATHISLWDASCEHTTVLFCSGHAVKWLRRYAREPHVTVGCAVGHGPTLWGRLGDVLLRMEPV